jgi:nucleoside-diphosphate-sugar epimerase
MSVHSVIGGNGTIGAVAVRHLAAAGCEVRIVQRHPRLIEGAVATASADVFDLDGLTKAVEGSDVIYLILGLPYDAKVWLEGFPRAVSHAVEAARRVGARLVYFDNVYMYGPVQGVMTEDTPDNPTTQKGLARARAARVLMEAVEKGAIRGLIARSADFYGDYRVELTPLQTTLFRAGHAHAGALVILSLVLQILLDFAELPTGARWLARGAAPAAAVLVSGGFFGIAFTPRLAVLLWAGALSLGASVLLTGIGLLRPPLDE